MNKIKLISRILVIPVAVTLVFVIFGVYKKEKLTPTVRAMGDLFVDFHVPQTDPNPIFTINDFKPGNCEERVIDVHNAGSVARFVAVKGVKTAPLDNEDDPFKLELIANLNITDPTDLFDQTLSTFFIDSNQENGVSLSVVGPGDDASYNFKVCFPPEAGNDYQEKTATFDLTFGVITSDNLVINEVYYQVDSSHGQDSPKDRGVKNNIEISGNGAGSKNLIDFRVKNTCVTVQQNTTTAQGSVTAQANSGGNTASGTSGGLTIIKTGNSSVKVNFTVIGGSNTASSCGSCCTNQGQNDEWVEIYNPTDQDISLKNWGLMDNSDNITKITANKIIKAGEFALISKNSSPWKFWNEDKDAKKVEIGKDIGDGLDNEGDHLYLINPQGETVDFTAWGNDTAIWDPAVPLVALGNSMERLVPGFDSNLPTDWEPQSPPTPGF